MIGGVNLRWAPAAIFMVAVLFSAGCDDGGSEAPLPSVAILTYASPGDKVSTDFTVTVNGTAVNVTEFFGMHYAHLAAAGPVEVVATASENITRFSISPKRLAIPGTVEGKSLRFTINCSQPRYLILFINSLPHLCILIDQPEVNPPQLTDANVVNAMDYLTDATGTTAQTERFAAAIAAVNGTGKILFVPAGCYLTDTIRIKDCTNFTLYLAPGCLIRTVLCQPNAPQSMHGMSIEDSSNITILGRGVLDNQAAQNLSLSGITYENSGAYPVFGARNQHLTIDGLTARNARNWNYSIVESDDLVMRQVKAITPPACSPNWTDGINLSSDQGVLIDHAFAYCNDDSFASGHYYDWGSTRDSSGHVIRNMVGWNPRANGIRIGFDCSYNLNDYTFENCDFIGQNNAGLMIHGLKNNGYYTRIRLENCSFEMPAAMYYGLVFTTGPWYGGWPPASEPLPHIDSLELVNVTLDAVTPSTIAGNPDGGIKHLLIDNLVMNGHRCTDLQDARITVSHVDDVVFTTPSYTVATTVSEGTLLVNGDYSGANTYTGATTISAGTLMLDNTAALGTADAGTTVASGAVLDLNGITMSAAPILCRGGWW